MLINNTFELLDDTLTIGENLAKYNDLLNRYKKLASDACEKFAKFYSDNKYLEDVINNVPSQIVQSIIFAIDESIEFLIKEKIYTVDRDSFFETYVMTSDSWLAAYQKICDQYADIVLSDEQKQLYRKNRRENRSKWIGGGFGLNSAIKGAVTAGSLNIVSGIAHSTVNLLGNIKSSIASGWKQQKIFNDPKTFDSLRYDVYNIVRDMHIGIIKCLYEYGHNDSYLTGAIKTEEVNEMVSIMKNIELISNKEEKKKLLVSAFYLNPYYEKWYSYVYDTYGDKNGELERLSRYFCVSIVVDMKRNDISKFAKNLNLSTETQALKSKNKLLEYMGKISYNEDCDELKKIDKCLAKFDKEAREVDGIVFDTRQEADINRKDHIVIKKILKSNGNNDLTDLQKALEQISKISSKIGRKYSEKLSKEISKLDIQARTVSFTLETEMEIVMDTKEEAETAVGYIEEIYEVINKSKIDSFGSYHYVIFLKKLLEAMRMDKRYNEVKKISFVYEEFFEKLYKEAEAKQTSLVNSVKDNYLKAKNLYKNRVYMFEDLERNSKTIENAKNSYMYKQGYKNDEKIWFLHDATPIAKNGKAGFCITERGLYHSNGFIERSRLTLQDIKKAEYENLNICGQLVKTFYLPYTISDIWDIIQIMPSCYSNMVIYLSSSELAKEIKKRKISYRIQGQYKDYYSSFEYTTNVTNEINDSIYNGNIYNYGELATYIDKVLEKFSPNDLAHISLFQKSKFKKAEIHNNAINLYMKKVGFSLHEYPTIFYVDQTNSFEGFAITSRGVYVFSKTGNDFFPVNKSFSVTCVWENGMMKLGNRDINLSRIQLENRKILVDLVVFLIRKIPEINTYTLNLLDEKVRKGELTNDEYVIRLSGFALDEKKIEENPSLKTHDIVICKFCGGENNNTKKFCRYCGKELENTLVSEPNNLTEKAVVCSSCGNTILNGKSFCSKCGKKVN